MRTSTQRLMARGAAVLVGVAILSGLAGWARRATADDVPQPLAALDALQGEIELATLRLQRAESVIVYSGRYQIPADLAAAVFDHARNEGIDPDLAFGLVHVESRFNSRAISSVGALGLTQIMPATAKFYEPDVTDEQLFEAETNLRLGFRYLRHLLNRYEGDLRLALLAYNRGPARVQALLGLGQDPSNGYAESVLEGLN